MRERRRMPNYSGVIDNLSLPQYVESFDTSRVVDLYSVNSLMRVSARGYVRDMEPID
jgi:hypothetical protein